MEVSCLESLAEHGDRTMYLHTRLLLGIAVVTLVALCISLVAPLLSVRTDVYQETEASTQLARLLHHVESAALSANSSADALDAAADRVKHSPPLRHVKIELMDARGRIIASSPTDVVRGGRLAQALLPSGPTQTLRYAIEYQDAPIAQLRVLTNPLSEMAEIEQRVVYDLLLLALTIVAMAASIYFIVRRGLKPVAQIQVALTRLEAGDLETRLPGFRLKDLQEISQRFNQCAAAMQEATAQRHELTRRLIGVEEEERKRLARELHDEFGQILTAIKVDAAYIAREATGSSPKIESCARGVEQMTGDPMEIIRGMLARLRPHGLETVGLRDTVQELVNGWQTRVADKFKCTLEFSGPVNSLPPDLNMTVYRLIQECLTNAVRYSRARAITMRLDVETGPAGVRAERVALHVQETDVDSDPGAVRTKGSGLLGMRERVEAHGGELRVDITHSGGMSLHAWMPVIREEAEIA
jgi:two-component system, NarL family, sensor histidine kinase UhpB